MNAKNKEENTPLHEAAANGNSLCAEVLIEFGADANIKDKQVGELVCTLFDSIG